MLQLRRASGTRESGSHWYKPTDDCHWAIGKAAGVRADALINWVAIGLSVSAWTSQCSGQLKHIHELDMDPTADHTYKGFSYLIWNVVGKSPQLIAFWYVGLMKPMKIIAPTKRARFVKNNSPTNIFWTEDVNFWKTMFSAYHTELQQSQLSLIILIYFRSNSAKIRTN